MNRKERVLTSLRGGSPDRVPVIPAATYATAHLRGVGVREAGADPALMAECLFLGQEAAGSDGLYLGWESSFNLAAAALGCRLTAPEEDVPAVERPLLAGRDPDPDRVDPARIEGDPGVAVGAAAGRILAERAGGEWPLLAYVPGPFTLAGLLRGSEQLLLDAVERPGLVAELVERSLQAGLVYARTRAAVGAEVLVVADPMASCSLISPAMFRRLAKEPLARFLAVIGEELECIPSLHICGRTTPILVDLAEIGARVVELDHAVDLAEAVRILPPEVVIQGNVDPALLLAGPVAAIRKAAEHCLAQCAGRPFILSTGCEVALRTPVEHYRALTGVEGRAY